MSGGSQAPDPYQTAAAQTQSNQQTANYNAALNRVNQVTPYGSSTYTQNGTDSTGAPNYTQTISLAPEVQSQLDNQLKQNDSLSNLGFNLGDQAKSSLSSGLDTSKLPALAGAPNAGPVQSGYGGYGNVQTSLDYSKLPQLYGGNDFQQSAKDTANAVYQQAASRLDPQWNNTQNQQDAKLANMGVMYGSGAYGKAQTQLDQAKNDAYNQANFSSILAGNDEQQRLFGDSLQQRQQMAGEANAQGAFANSAQAQAYGQAQQNAQFANAAQAQKYAQALQGAQFGNQARAQGLTEQTNLRDLPLNELNALRSSTQIQNPQFSSVPQSTAAGTDISGDIYKSAQIDAANSNNFMNGLMGLGSAAISKWSDRRLKRDIRRVGETPMMRLPLYAFRYVWDDILHVGVMAQDVLKVKPEAVARRGQFLAVDYAALA
jgi:hypothetical protein